MPCKSQYSHSHFRYHFAISTHMHTGHKYTYVTKVHPYMQLLPKQALFFLKAHERKRATYHLLPRVQGQSIETEGWRQGGSKEILSLYLAAYTHLLPPHALALAPEIGGFMKSSRGAERANLRVTLFFISCCSITKSELDR